MTRIFWCNASFEDVEINNAGMTSYNFCSISGFPRPPADLSGLSEEELRAMEGIERENVEARIQWLRDIQSLLDGAMLLIQQYNTVAANSR